MSSTLDIAGLSVTYGAKTDRPLHAVRDLSFHIEPGEAYGLIGQFGIGKSTVAYAIMRHLPAAQITAQHIALQGRDLLNLPQQELARMRGSQIAMVYQDPMSALNPILRIGEQVAEVLRRHRGMTRAEATSARWHCWNRCICQSREGSRGAIPTNCPAENSNASSSRWQ